MHPVRLATGEDVAELVRLRAVMFEAMGVTSSSPDWERSCRMFLEERLTDGRVIGFVVDAPDVSGLAACGLAELSSRIPSPARAAGSQAYLSSFSTDPRWRRTGMGGAVLSHLLAELRALGVRRAELHATPDGARLYRLAGFQPRPGGLEMRLDF